MFIRSRRGVAVGVLIALAVAGAAYAYWTTTGSGSGSASTTTNQTVVITQTSPVTGMYPGSPNQDVPFKITNPAAGNQYVNKVTAAIGTIVKTSDGSTATGCTAADFALTQAPTDVAQDLPPGDTSFAGTAAKLPKIRMINAATNQDACKNVTVNLTFSSN